MRSLVLQARPCYQRRAVDIRLSNRRSSVRSTTGCITRPVIARTSAGQTGWIIVASGAWIWRFVVNTDARMNRIISGGSNVVVGRVRTWQITIWTSGVRIRQFVVISDVWISWIISDGRVSDIAGMLMVVVCGSVSIEASAYFLP